MLNVFIFSGFLGGEPELKTYSRQDGSQGKIANFSVAVSRDFKNKDGKYDSDWFRCTAYDRNADFASQYLHKGTKVNCVGRVEINQGTNKEGQPVTYTNIRLSSIEFAERAATAQANGVAVTASAPQAQPMPNMGMGMGMAPQMPNQANVVNQVGLDAGWQNVPGVITEDLPFN